jgi:hypothetical protein
MGMLLGGISFAAPWVLIALAGLPALYFLLRATPALPRRVPFPALALLRGLNQAERTPARMPLWILVLRLVALALLIIGLAGPALVPPPLLPGRGPILLVIDNGFAAGADFSAVRRAARRVVAQAGQDGVVLLATAPDATGQKLQASGVLTPRAALARLGVLPVQPWPDDDRAALQAVRAVLRQGKMRSVFITDGLAGPGRAALIRSLAPDLSLTDGAARVRVVQRAQLGPHGGLQVRLAVVPHDRPVVAAVLAETQADAVLARATIRVPPGAGFGSTRIDLPPPLLDQVTRLVLAGPAEAAGVLLLDGAARRVSVGIVGGAQAAQKFLGADYYVQRAIPRADAVHVGTLGTLLADQPGVLILPDMPLDPAQMQKLKRFLEQGGVVIRFAGPLSATTRDDLTPDPLVPGVRHVGGALGAGKPGRIGAFAAGSPLAGLAVPADVRISAARLVDPTRLNPATVWARLQDGTPIVLGVRQGRGTLVYVLTSANTAWSNWVLAADFPQVMERLLRLGVGARPRHGKVQVIRALDGLGQLGRAGAAARAVRVRNLDTLMVSPAHPPGLWGNAQGRIAVNVGAHVPVLRAGRMPDGAAQARLSGLRRTLHYGPALIATGLLLLLADLLISLWLRGLVAWRAVLGAALLVVLCSGAVRPARAQGPNGAGDADQAVPTGALRTRLAYIATGDAARDRTIRLGLQEISRLVDGETAAKLGRPRAVVPGAEPLDFYPLIYWMVTAVSPTPDGQACRALDGFMASGGLLVIDTDGGDAGSAGSGAGFDPGAGAALRRVTACLAIPPLARLTDRATLGHSFFIVRQFPGRFVGAPVLIAAKGGRDADGMSPVVIGQNDWVGAWARRRDGAALHAVLPGDPGQRTDSERFGVNLVIYALTGTYKSDQVQLPMLLQRLAPQRAP